MWSNQFGFRKFFCSDRISQQRVQKPTIKVKESSLGASSNLAVQKIVNNSESLPVLSSVLGKQELGKCSHPCINSKLGKIIIPATKKHRSGCVA